MVSQNKLEEVKFQANRAGNIQKINPTPHQIFSKYKKNRFHYLFIKEFLFKHLGDLDNKYICDLGCGEGELSTIMAKFGAKVMAIDISPELINIAKSKADLDGVSNNIEFIVGDAENYIFNNKFDAVICYGVLHHMNVQTILPRIHESLCESGKFILVEPVDMAPCFQKIISFLNIKKVSSSPSEKPLKYQDLKTVQKYFRPIISRAFHLFGRVTRILPGSNLIDYGNSFVKLLLFIAGLVDFLLLIIFPPIRILYRVRVGIYTKITNSRLSRLVTKTLNY